MSSTAPEGKQLYQDWVVDQNRNIVHILEDLPSCRPPIDHLCELLPRLQPRYYSISSSAKVLKLNLLGEINLFYSNTKERVFLCFSYILLQYISLRFLLNTKPQRVGSIRGLLHHGLQNSILTQKSLQWFLYLLEKVNLGLYENIL